MRALVNQAFDVRALPAPNDQALAFHRSLPGYEPTPVVQLAGVAGELGIASVQLKDESNRLGLPAFKVLGASWAIELALRAEPQTQTLIAASAGNHGRAVAHCAARRGLRCRIYLPRQSLAARRGAIAAEGAEIVVVPGGYQHAVESAARAAADDGALLIADIGEEGPPAWVIDGYNTLFAEASRQAAYDLIIVPAGVGSLAAAAARHGAVFGAAVVAVEPHAAACLTASLAAGRPTDVPTPGTTMAGLDCSEVSPAAWPTLRPGISGTVTIGDDEADAAIAELGDHGLTIGASGAATLAGLRALMQDDECLELRTRLALGAHTRVLLIATEGDTSKR